MQTEHAKIPSLTASNAELISDEGLLKAEKALIWHDITCRIHLEPVMESDTNWRVVKSYKLIFLS